MTSSVSQVVCTFNLNNTKDVHYMTVAVGREHCLLNDGNSNTCRLSDQVCRQKLIGCGLLERYMVEGPDIVPINIMTFNLTVAGEEVCCLVGSSVRECETFPLYTSKY